MKRLIQRFIVWYLERKTMFGEGFRCPMGKFDSKYVVLMDRKIYHQFRQLRNRPQETIAKTTASIGMDTTEFDAKMAKVMESLENLANKNEHLYASFIETMRVAEGFESSILKVSIVTENVNDDQLEKLKKEMIEGMKNDGRNLEQVEKFNVQIVPNYLVEEKKDEYPVLAAEVRKQDTVSNSSWYALSPKAYREWLHFRNKYIAIPETRQEVEK